MSWVSSVHPDVCPDELTPFVHIFFSRPLDRFWCKVSKQVEAKNQSNDCTKNQSGKISMSGLQTYCEHTSLHGWYYIAKDSKYWKIVWTIIVLASIIVASLFIYKAAEDFTKSTVVTTIQSTTVPLSEVYFPAVTVCNINQVSNSTNSAEKTFVREPNFLF